MATNAEELKTLFTSCPQFKTLRITHGKRGVSLSFKADVCFGNDVVHKKNEYIALQDLRVAIIEQLKKYLSSPGGIQRERYEKILQHFEGT